MRQHGLYIRFIHALRFQRAAGMLQMLLRVCHSPRHAHSRWRANAAVRAEMRGHRAHGRAHRQRMLAQM